MKESEYLSQTYSYLALRKAVGWIGILLPFVLAMGAFVLFDCFLPDHQRRTIQLAGLCSSGLCRIFLFYPCSVLIIPVY